MNESFENCQRITKLFIEKFINNRPELLDISSIINLFLNAILTVTATLCNAMIIVAILRSPNLQTPSYLLITSLAFVDLLVGLVLHPLQVVGGTFLMQRNIRGLCAMANIYYCFALYLSAVSIMVITGISIDRYLALTLRHRYSLIVTKKRVRFFIVFTWVLGFLGNLSNIFEKFHFVLSRALFLCYLVFLLTICVFYIKSFRALHLYTVEVHAQQPNPLAGNFDVVRYKKILKTMVLVLACLLLCYLPLVCVLMSAKILDKRKEEFPLYFTSMTLMCLNSSINPVIYLVRFTDIRNACREIWRCVVN